MIRLAILPRVTRPESAVLRHHMLVPWYHGRMSRVKGKISRVFGLFSRKSREILR